MSATVRALVEGFLGHADGLLGPYSAVLYGSAARGDWDPVRSDINLLLVPDQLGPAELRALGPALGELGPEWRTPPLLVPRAEWERSVDVFPLELADMILAHEVLRGPDPLAGLAPHPTLLRAELERELRTKLIRLRQGYALRADDPAALGLFATQTLGTMLVMARGTLVLLGRPVPDHAVGVARAFAEVTGASATPMVEVAAQWGRTGWSCPAATFEEYLVSIAAAAAFIDHHVPGAH